MAETEGPRSTLARETDAPDAGFVVPDGALSKPRGGGRRDPRSMFKRLFSFEELGITIALVTLVLLIGVFHPAFLHRVSVLNTLQTASFVAIMACGMVFLLAMGELDLSLGGTYALSTIIAAELMSGGMNPWLAVVLGIASGAGLGAVNGILASLLRLPLIIITLGTLSAYQGFATVLSHSGPVENLPTTSSFFSTLGGDWLGFPVAAWAALIFVVGLSFLFTRTRFGTMVRAIGSNHDAASFSGIPSGRIRLYAVISDRRARRRVRNASPSHTSRAPIPRSGERPSSCR